MIEVHVTYAWNGDFHLDDVAVRAAGRSQDFSGAGFGERDLGWECESELEAKRIKRDLKKVGLSAEICRESTPLTQA